MPSWTRFIISCTAFYICRSSSDSCDSTDVAQQHGAAMLQVLRSSKSLNVASDEAMKYTMDAAGYNAAKKTCCLREMGEFISALAVSMEYKICNIGFGAGLAHWHTCDGTGADSTFKDLKDYIVEYSNKPCSVITDAKICPKLDPQVCPPFIPKITELPQCACSKTKVVPLDFGSVKTPLRQNNLAGKGPRSGANAKEEIFYESLGSIGSPAEYFNLIVTGINDITTYGKKNNGYNGITGEDKEYRSGQIGMLEGHSIDLKFDFQFANGSAATLPEVHFTFWDIDATPRSNETITVTGFTEYVIDRVTDIQVTDEGTTSDPNVKVATFLNPNKNEGVVKLKGTNLELDADARKAAVMMIFKDVSTFTVIFKTTGDKSPDKQSHLKFNGGSDLEDHCVA